jgi:L-lysine 2,3-aminomutase
MGDRYESQIHWDNSFRLPEAAEQDLAILRQENVKLTNEVILLKLRLRDAETLTRLLAKTLEVMG